MYKDFPPGFDSDELRSFVDALRDFLGLEPLYCAREPKGPTLQPDIFIEGWITIPGGRQRAKPRPMHKRAV